MILNSSEITVNAAPRVVFNFLADIENFPRWAGSYCERLDLAGGDWCALTADGDVPVRMEVDQAELVIEIDFGVSSAPRRRFTLKVSEVGGNVSAIHLAITARCVPTNVSGETVDGIARDILVSLLSRFGGGASNWQITSDERPPTECTRALTVVI